MNLLKYLILVLVFALFSCAKNEPEPNKYVDAEELYKSNSLKISIKQGLAGTLLIKEGNCMPPVNLSGNNCGSYPAARKVMVFDYTKIDELHGYGPFFDLVESKFIAETYSDEDGFFQIGLSEGKYSVFVFENNCYYASGGDGQGGMWPFEITSGEVLINNLTVDYASY